MASAAESPRQIDIPAQPLASALRQFADQTGLQLAFETSLITGRTSPEVKGQLSSKEAIARLLQGTGLRYDFLDERTVAVSAASADKNPTSLLSPTGAAAGEDSIRLTQVQASAAASDDSITNDTAQQSNLNSITEIIVTATKRSQSIQDVPMSITAITAEEIDQRGLVGAADYLRGIPGVNQLDGGYQGQAIVIRGLETSTGFQNWASGGTLAASYFGEMPMSNSAGLLGSSTDAKLVDIERVEVLRGPQGTAFGSSSMTGAVRTIPVAPKLNGFEGRLAAGYSATSGSGGGNHNVQAVVNIPVIEGRLALRASGYQYDDSGFYRNRAGSDPVLRAAAVTPYGAEAYALDSDDVGAAKSTGARVAALWQATDDLRFTFTYLTQDDEIDAHPIASSGVYAQSLLGVAPEHVLRGQKEGVNDSNLDAANALIEYDLQWADLLATYSYIKSDSDHMVPATLFSIPWPVSFHSRDPHREYSGEIRLATKFDGAWNFIAGLYADDHDDTYATQWVWFAEPSFLGEGLIYDYSDRRAQKQKAAFAEVSWEFLPRFTLTGGARAYDYERQSQIDATGPINGGITTSQLTDTDASGTSYRANLSYKPGNDKLVYASWAQGFRLGRPQAPASAPPCDSDSDGVVDGTNIPVASTGHIDSDSVDSYELGGKVSLFDRRLNIDTAVFRMDWSDLPVGAPGPTTCTGFLTNAGAARSEGVELQASFLITDRLRADLGGSYIDAQIMEDSPTGDLRAGDQLPGAPEITANLSLQYQFNLARWPAFLRADSIYVGPFHSDVPGAARRFTGAREAGDYLKLDLTGRVVLRSLNLDLYVRNLTNENAFSSRNSNPLVSPYSGTYMRPRTVGLQLSYDFD